MGKQFVTSQSLPPLSIPRHSSGDRKDASSTSLLSVPSSLLDKEVTVRPRGFGSSCLLGQPSPRVAKVGVVGGELRLWPAQSGGEATRRRWGGGRSRPKGGEGGRRRTRVPGLVPAGSQEPAPRQPRRDGRRQGPARPGHPPPAAAGGRPTPGGPGGPSGRGRLDPGEGEGLLLRDCIWAALARAGTPTWAGWEAGQSRGPPSLRPEESGLCVLASVPRWPPGGFGDASGAG